MKAEYLINKTSISKMLIMSILLIFPLSKASAQAEFPYPAIPDTIRQVQERAAYLAKHYWDNFNFADTLQLEDKEMAEQGFVNFIDILARFDQHIAVEGISAFSTQAYSNPQAKDKFESLIEHYYENPQSPLRNDRIYALFLQKMAELPCFDEVEKERIDFKLKAANKNLPGSTAINLTFKGEDGKKHQLSEYKDTQVILYLYDPECENCHKVTAWLKQQSIPASIKMLRIVADMHISSLYSVKAMPTIYLLDKGNKVILKDCTPEQLIEAIQNNNK